MAAARTGSVGSVWKSQSSRGQEYDFAVILELDHWSLAGVIIENRL